jgi:hypothetical protein
LDEGSQAGTPAPSQAGTPAPSQAGTPAPSQAGNPAPPMPATPSSANTDGDGNAVGGGNALGDGYQLILSPLRAAFAERNNAENLRILGEKAAEKVAARASSSCPKKQKVTGALRKQAVLLRKLPADLADLAAVRSYFRGAEVPVISEDDLLLDKKDVSTLPAAAAAVCCLLLPVPACSCLLHLLLAAPACSCLLLPACSRQLLRADAPCHALRLGACMGSSCPPLHTTSMCQHLTPPPLLPLAAPCAGQGQGWLRGGVRRQVGRDAAPVRVQAQQGGGQRGAAGGAVGGVCHACARALRARRRRLLLPGRGGDSGRGRLGGAAGRGRGGRSLLSRLCQSMCACCSAQVAQCSALGRRLKPEPLPPLPPLPPAQVYKEALGNAESVLDAIKEHPKFPELQVRGLAQAHPAASTAMCCVLTVAHKLLTAARLPACLPACRLALLAHLPADPGLLARCTSTVPSLECRAHGLLHVACKPAQSHAASGRRLSMAQHAEPNMHSSAQLIISHHACTHAPPLTPSAPLLPLMQRTGLWPKLLAMYLMFVSCTMHSAHTKCHVAHLDLKGQNVLVFANMLRRSGADGELERVVDWLVKQALVDKMWHVVFAVCDWGIAASFGASGIIPGAVGNGTSM